MIKFDFKDKFGIDQEKIKTSQNPWEFQKWGDWIQEEFPRDKPFKYLEIGSYAGESLYYLSQVLPKGSHICLVDLGDNGVARDVLTKKVIPYVTSVADFKIILVSGDSRSTSLIDKVKEICPRYDLVFIDANHNFEFAFADFVNYRDKANWIAFHDISWFNTAKTKVKYGVYQANANHLWEVIKVMVKEKEIQHIYGPGDFVKENHEQINWFEFVGEVNPSDDEKLQQKPRGFGVLRSQW